MILASLRRLPVFALLLLAGCGQGHGPKVVHGTVEVFYLDGATKEEADRLGAYLSRTWPAGANRRSVQLRKAGDGYQLRMVVMKDFQNDEKIQKAFSFDAARVSRDVFGGANVETHVCDEHFTTLKVVPPNPDVRYGVVEGKAEVYYAKAADKDDAQRLARYLDTQLKDAPGLVTFRLARRDQVIEVNMVTRVDLVNQPGFLADLQKDRAAIAANVFNGAPVEMHLCDELLNVVQVLRP